MLDFSLHCRTHGHRAVGVGDAAAESPGLALAGAQKLEGVVVRVVFAFQMFP